MPRWGRVGRALEAGHTCTPGIGYRCVFGFLPLVLCGMWGRTSGRPSVPKSWLLRADCCHRKDSLASWTGCWRERAGFWARLPQTVASVRFSPVVRHCRFLYSVAASEHI